MSRKLSEVDDHCDSVYVSECVGACRSPFMGGNGITNIRGETRCVR